MAVRMKGGDVFGRELQRAKQQQRTTVEVGIFPDAVYPDGKSVAEIATLHEFGLSGRGESAPFRASLNDIELAMKLHNKRVRGTDVDESARRAGRDAMNSIKSKIVEVGLIQTGRMLGSVRSEVEKCRSPAA